jgi:hypothetical protein
VELIYDVGECTIFMSSSLTFSYVGGMDVDQRTGMGIWICRSEIKKLNNHQKSDDLYRNVGERIF